MEESDVLDDTFSDLIEEDCPEIRTDLKCPTENVCKIEEQEEFICFQCFKEFESEFELLHHIEHEHFVHVCSKCSKKFPTDKRLKKHLRDAHLSGKFPCPVCDKVFTRKDHCRDHIYTHSSKPLFPCKYENCDKVFRQSSNLKQHERCHTGDNRKTCPICNESIAQLSKHLNSHLQLKEHPCMTCDKSFTRRSYLIEHQKLHLGEAGFLCDECKTEFRTSNALYKHKRSKHSMERYICELPECRQVFNRKDNMVSHMKRRHRLIVETVQVDNNVVI